MPIKSVVVWSCTGLSVTLGGVLLMRLKAFWFAWKADDDQGDPDRPWFPIA